MIQKALSKRFGTIARKAGKLLVRFRKIEEAFVKSGGKLIPRNRYLLGYKTITVDPAGLKNIVVLYFNRYYTGSKTGRNKGGKPPVMIIASNKDLAELIAQGVEYY